MIYPSVYTFPLFESPSLPSMLEKSIEIRNTLMKQGLDLAQYSNYVYTPEEAIGELGLDADLIEQLIRDYVIQIIKTYPLFSRCLNELHTKEKNDYTSLRELAHKNLGVVRNLRIKDAEELLRRIMKSEDLELIYLALQTLYACATILRPKEAFDTLKLLKAKEYL